LTALCGSINPMMTGSPDLLASAGPLRGAGCVRRFGISCVVVRPLVWFSMFVHGSFRHRPRLPLRLVALTALCGFIRPMMAGSPDLLVSAGPLRGAGCVRRFGISCVVVCPLVRFLCLFIVLFDFDFNFNCVLLC
jgi:hypothetical protein